MAKPTQAQLIMEARYSYARYPAGMVDETDLHLLSQHYGELRVRAKEAGRRYIKKRGKRKRQPKSKK